MLRLLVLFILSLTAQLLSGSVVAAEVRIAVASNFTHTARALVKQYESISENSVRLLIGSTGKHASQIQHGLKVDVFLAADSIRPRLLEEGGFAISGSRFTYALGRLALWSRDEGLVDSGGEVLLSQNYKYLSIANPKTAPYGIAAKDVLSKLGASPKLVYGESVSQAFQFASSGNAELALVAYPQIKGIDTGSFWLIPSDLHRPIEQQALLLSDTEPARDFIGFLKSDAALKLIELHGYLRP